MQVFSAISAVGNTTTLVLLVTELMGLYAISSLLLIRKQLPIKYRCRVAQLPLLPCSTEQTCASCLPVARCMR